MRWTSAPAVRVLIWGAEDYLLPKSSAPWPRFRWTGREAPQLWTARSARTRPKYLIWVFWPAIPIWPFTIQVWCAAHLATTSPSPPRTLSAPSSVSEQSTLNWRCPALSICYQGISCNYQVSPEDSDLFQIALAEILSRWGWLLRSEPTSCSYPASTAWWRCAIYPLYFSALSAGFQSIPQKPGRIRQAALRPTMAEHQGSTVASLSLRLAPVP